MQRIRIQLLTNNKVFESTICYHVNLRINLIFYENQHFTLIDLLLEIASPALIFFNIKIENYLIKIFSKLINLNH